MKRIFKSFAVGLEDLKAAAGGKVRAVIATLNVVDKDGDVTLPGFFGKQDAMVVPVHDWNHVPIGKAVISEDGDKAVADIQLNLELQAAKDWLSALKFDLENGEPLQEWSYGFKVLEGGYAAGQHQGRNVRFLRPREDGSPGCKVWEVSPVLVGAGEGTGTVAAKSADTPEGEGKRFCDEALSVLDAVEDLLARGKSLADIRAQKGREMSAANKERLAAIADSLTKTAQQVAALLVPVAQPEPSAVTAAAREEFGRFLRLQSGI